MKIAVWITEQTAAIWIGGNLRNYCTSDDVVQKITLENLLVNQIVFNSWKTRLKSDFVEEMSVILME